MTPAGFINIDLYHCSGKVSRVNITSSRPDTVAQVFIGKTPEQLLDTVPLLFTLCGNAQAYAALWACRAALGLATEPDLDAARDLLVQLETLREHAWRILLDWPGFAGLVPDKKALAALLKFDALFKRYLFRNGEAFKLHSRLDVDARQLTLLIDELEALIDVSVFKSRLADFRMLSCESRLQDWLEQNDALPAHLLNHLYKRNWAASGQNAMLCLPRLGAEALNRQMREQATFSRLPCWQGRCFETTLLNRQLLRPLIADLHSRYGNGLMVRMVARLSEIALIPSRLRRLSARLADLPAVPARASANDGVGLSRIQAARGLLIHRLELRQGRVYDYRLVAPTEWNFHPEGIVVQSLKQLQAESLNDLRRQAELLINAIDPCVHYTLNLTDKR